MDIKYKNSASVNSVFLKYLELKDAKNSAKIKIPGGKNIKVNNLDKKTIPQPYYIYDIIASMKKIAILFSGTGTNFEYLCKNLHKKDIEIVVALTNNPKAGGIDIAKRYNIPLIILDSSQYKIREEFDKEVVKKLKEYNFDFVVLAGFMRILTPIFTNAFLSINLHPSLLPRHKGLKAIERSYNDEFEDGGVSVHYVTDELDGGDIILQKSIKKAGLTFDEYYNKIRAIEKEALKEAVLKVANSI